MKERQGDKEEKRKAVEDEQGRLFSYTLPSKDRNAVSICGPHCYWVASAERPLALLYVQSLCSVSVPSQMG